MGDVNVAPAPSSGALADEGKNAATVTIKRRLTIEPGAGLGSVKDTKKKAAAVVEIPTGLRFIFGTISAVSATFFTHPIDVVKYKLQVSGRKGLRAYNGTIDAARGMMKDEGVMGFYRGLTASMMRQVSYGSTRLGMYSSLMEKYTAKDGTPPPLYQKLVFSMSAGGIGAIVGNPFDLALVRMAADSSLPAAERRNYTGVFDAVARIIKTEGFQALWTGSSPTVTRCIILNAAQLTTYSQAKEELLRTPYFEDNILLHFSASMISGFVATAASLPFDVAKTRLQNAKSGEYSGMVDCLVQTAKQEGPLSLWKGFTPSYLRLAPQTVLVFVFLEQLTQIFGRLSGQVKE